MLSFSATNRKPANWDKLVIERLALDPSAARDEIVSYQTAEGKPWKALIRMVQEATELLTRPRAPEELAPVAELDCMYHR